MDELVERLRGLEAEALRLSTLNVPGDLLLVLAQYEDRLQELYAAHSRSWFGDHASTYYRNFKPPPGGRTFDVEWGFILGLNGTRNPDWRSYSRQEIKAFVFSDFGERIFHKVEQLEGEIREGFFLIREQALDLLNLMLGRVEVASISRYLSMIDEETKPYSFADYVNGELQSAPNMTRDSEEAAKGRIVPAHVQYYSMVHSVKVNRKKLVKFSSILRNIINLISLSGLEKTVMSTNRKVFIGHGRSEQWRVLKDFLRERLGLDYEEFNRVPVAGLSTQERLQEMMDQCGFALLMLTAEDLHGDQSVHARENVVHEAGLFQGNLGWRRAIILLEEGCQEFSNIVGLGQVRFPKNNVSASFEQIRGVLQREGFISS